MSKELNGQDLINAFLAAIRLRRHEQCRTILESLEALTGQYPMLKAWCVYFEGYQVFEFQRDWAQAEQIFTKLIQTEPEPTLHGQVLYTLGRSFDAQGRWEEAIAAFEQSLQISIQLGDVIEQARAWKHKAISLHKGYTQGDFGPAALQQGIEYCQLALAALDSISDPSRDVVWLKGTVWNTLGALHFSLGQWDEAIACYQQDLAICRTLHDRFGIGLTLHNLGEVYFKRGQDYWLQALEAYKEALNLIREHKDHYEEMDVLANLAFLYQEKGEYELALDYYCQAINVIEDLRAGISAEAAQAGFFATVVNTYANTVLLYLYANRPEQAFNLVEQARSRAFLDSLAARSPELAEQAQQRETTTLTLAEAQAILPPDMLLLEYFTTGLIEAKEGRTTSQQAQRHRFPPAHILLFAITHDALAIHNIALSPNDLRPQKLDSVVERHFLQPQIQRTLYDQLIAPVEKLMQDKRRVYIVPHGPLHYIPFHALLAPDGEPLLRQHGPQMVYAPSATLLFRYGRVEPNHASTACLTLGYNGEEATQLRFAEEEASSIARLTFGQALVGTMPKKAIIYQEAPTYRRLHFSCHGEFDPETPLASALHLGPEETLTALDVLDQLRLRCDLVTLSACESGLSRVRRGDELVGLTRAFMYAGAPALVSTLWRVDERSTRLLMEKFYQEVQNGANFAEALKRAQLFVKGLTRREALTLLTRPEASSAEASTPATPSAEWQSDLLPTSVAWQQAGAYLKGLTNQTEPNEAAWSGEADEDHIFAAPFYWAPFILVM